MRGVVPIGVTAPRGATSVILVAGAQRQLVGEPASDCDSLPVVEAFERALPDVVGDRGELLQIGDAHAAHQHAGGVERRGRERLALDDRRRQPDALHGDTRSPPVPVGQRLIPAAGSAGGR